MTTVQRSACAPNTDNTEHTWQHGRMGALVMALALLATLWTGHAHSNTHPSSNHPAAEGTSTPTAQPPGLLLAHRYQQGMALDGYWVSEKYDGIRGYWDGQQLRTRQGHPIAAPAWFTAGWPTTTIEGELWVGRGQFTQTQSILAQTPAQGSAWRTVHWMVFDLPSHPGTFTERLTALQTLVQNLAQPWVQAVEQQPATTHAALMAQLHRTERAGGEGLMLHLGSSLYRAGRSSDMLKVKSFDDAEARVIGHLPGQGQWAGSTGALWLEMPTGARFKLSSGLTQALRTSPPALGSHITYRYQGLHPSGLPRFARFLRVRNDDMAPAATPSSP